MKDANAAAKEWGACKSSKVDGKMDKLLRDMFMALYALPHQEITVVDICRQRSDTYVTINLDIIMSQITGQYGLSFCSSILNPTCTRYKYLKRHIIANNI